MKRFTRRQVLYLIFILILIILSLPLKIAYRFQMVAVVYPLQEWSLKQGQDDSFASEIKNYRTDVLNQIKSYKFNRGDISEVQIRKNIKAGTTIHQGDTIGHIHSYFNSNKLIRLNNELDEELKKLEVESSGRKQAIIDQSIQEFTRANQQFDLEEKRYLRQKKLYADSIIASEKFDEAENAYKLAVINIEIARQKMLAMQSGGKPENIQLIKQRMESLKSEINTISELDAQYTIVAPFTGLVSFDGKNNIIISLSDTSAYILIFPVMINNLRYLKKLKAIRFKIPGKSEELDAEFISVEGNVQYMDNHQMAVACALVKNGETPVFPGMSVQCQVVCDDISLFEYLKRGIKFNF